VLIENYKVGDLAKHGLDYASLKQDHPGLIYCSVTGYGQDGPYAPRPGLDAVFQAQSGFAQIVGFPDEHGKAQPQVTGVVAVDIMTGQNAAMAILAALLHRERTGEGQAIDIALLDSAIAFTSYGAQQYLVSGKEPVMRAPVGPLEIVECADGPVLLLGTKDPHFVQMCRILGQPELAQDPRFSTAAERHVNRKALREILLELVRPWKRQALMDTLGEAGVMAGSLNTVAEVFNDPQVRARGIAQPLPTPKYPDLKIVASPLRFSATPVCYDRPPPGIGEHTEEVLREVLQLDADSIGSLRTSGVTSATPARQK
jgi:crotonobetainyl-CoA:carnitine CoA-transferase CaiB-like acyl-CoA transferase